MSSDISKTYPVGRQLQIPVSFGHLAAVEWGDPAGQPVLALHGWLDNAKSFTPLASLLIKTTSVRFLALELPGHGLSSHLGRGATYTNLNYVSAVWQALRHLNWDSFTLIGHSLGGIVSIIFAALFPQRITNLITLDVFYPELIYRARVDKMQEIITRAIDLEEREWSKPQEIGWQAAWNSFAEPRQLSPQNVDLLLERHLRPGSSEGFYILNRDHRLRQLDGPQFRETQAEPLLQLFTKNSPRFRWLALMADSEKLRRNETKRRMAEQVYTDLMPSFQMIIMPVDGHFFHMEQADLVATHVLRMITEKEQSPSSKL